MTPGLPRDTHPVNSSNDLGSLVLCEADNSLSRITHQHVRQ